MKPVEKALWYIESNFLKNISLSDVANASGLSRYHLLRVFGIATGHSVMNYVRARRLSEAAQKLAAGEQDILTIALEVGYQSHEAFSRAFLSQFGETPKNIREQKHSEAIQLVKPIQLNEELITTLDEPRIEKATSFKVAGVAEHFTFETNQAIPGLWQDFIPFLGKVPEQRGSATYGVCYNNDENGGFYYMAAMEVTSFYALPDKFSYQEIPEQKYAVFSHSEHISSIRKTTYTIWNEWLPNSNYQQAESADFERYDDRFDPQTGTGVVEIWIPIVE